MMAFRTARAACWSIVMSTGGPADLRGLSILVAVASIVGDSPEIGTALGEVAPQGSCFMTRLVVPWPERGAHVEELRPADALASSGRSE
jgi:hypothetical protein